MIEKYNLKICEKTKEKLEILKKVYEQQNEMIKNRVNSVVDRIVSIPQLHVRPIARGKAKAKTEFGAKVEISILNGYARIETLDFDAYNEGKNLISIIEKYKERTGYYLERVLTIHLIFVKIYTK